MKKKVEIKKKKKVRKKALVNNNQNNDSSHDNEQSKSEIGWMYMSILPEAAIQRCS